MRKPKFRTFKDRLREDLKAPQFKAHYATERQALKAQYRSLDRRPS